MVRDAVVRNFEIIGEAVKRLSPDFCAAQPAIPWKQIAGFRDELIHEYFGVDLEQVWQVVVEKNATIESRDREGDSTCSLKGGRSYRAIDRRKSFPWKLEMNPNRLKFNSPYVSLPLHQPLRRQNGQTWSRAEHGSGTKRWREEED